MNSQYTQLLTPSQQQEITALVSACRQFEPMSLSAPSEDGLDYYLLYEKQQLIAMLFLFFPEETVCECGAFTLPAWRKKGCFSRLLEEALAQIEHLEEDREIQIDFCFLTDSHTASAISVLDALGAAYWYSEYSMKRHLSSQDLLTDSSLLIREAEPNIYTASRQDTIIGTCVLLPSGQNAYFYGFEIREEFRGQGYGHDFLLGMFALLARSGFLSITLQVSGRNLPALSLYKKTGFLITDTLSYFLY